MGDLMSDTDTEVAEMETEGTEQEQQQEQPEDKRPKPTETVDFWKAKAREQEKRAKAGADAIKRLAEIDEASKSEAEKAADKVKAAEAEIAAVPAKVTAALREHLVKLHEIDDEDAELFLTADNPELLLKQIERLLGQSGKGQRKNYVPREGANTKTKADDDRAFVREFFGTSTS